jgi:hypothetical protein
MRFLGGDPTINDAAVAAARYAADQQAVAAAAAYIRQDQQILEQQGAMPPAVIDYDYSDPTPIFLLQNYWGDLSLSFDSFFPNVTFESSCQINNLTFAVYTPCYLDVRGCAFGNTALELVSGSVVNLDGADLGTISYIYLYDDATVTDDGYCGVYGAEVDLYTSSAYAPASVYLLSLYAITLGIDTYGPASVEISDVYASSIFINISETNYVGIPHTTSVVLPSAYGPGPYVSVYVTCDQNDADIIIDLTGQAISTFSTFDLSGMSYSSSLSLYLADNGLGMGDVDSLIYSLYTYVAGIGSLYLYLAGEYTSWPSEVGQEQLQLVSEYTYLYDASQTYPPSIYVNEATGIFADADGEHTYQGQYDYHPYWRTTSLACPDWWVYWEENTPGGATFILSDTEPGSFNSGLTNWLRSDWSGTPHFYWYGGYSNTPHSATISLEYVEPS